MKTRFRQFGLVLMVNHACNLRCDYCYTGAKFSRRMPFTIGKKAIDRALASLEPMGTLELGFFGGEPLLEVGLVSALMDYARSTASERGAGVGFSLTTNGTVSSPDAWQILRRNDVDVAVSHDGVPAVHNQHRCGADGAGTSEETLRTIRELVCAKRTVRVVMVVRPDTVDRLPEGIRFLQQTGVRAIEPSLDLWTRWTSEDGRKLEAAIGESARLWANNLPKLSISWFDEKAAQLAHLPAPPSARCGFGSGEIAVAPSGNLYPCERLIQNDAEDNVARLEGHALAGEDFLSFAEAPNRSNENCDACQVRQLCSTTCRCSNFIRTGKANEPDGLLCLLNQVCLREVAQALGGTS